MNYQKVEGIWIGRDTSRFCQNDFDLPAFNPAGSELVSAWPMQFPSRETQAPSCCIRRMGFQSANSSFIVFVADVLNSRMPSSIQRPCELLSGVMRVSRLGKNRVKRINSGRDSPLKWIQQNLMLDGVQTTKLRSMRPVQAFRLSLRLPMPALSRRPAL